MASEDAKLVEVVLSGKVSAYALLVEKYTPDVYGYIIKMFGALDADIEDLCQEVFIAGFAGLSTLDNKENFRGWLLGIASNKVKTKIRERIRDRKAAAEILEDEKIVAGETQEEIAVERIKELVRKGLSHLPDDMREVIALKYFGNLSYEEIAGILDIPKSTVRGRMYRAYQELRNIFREKNR